MDVLGLGQGVKKHGVYRKLRTSKKKYFVLREAVTANPACVEYYDIEKKLKPGTKPKKVVDLGSCFSINAKHDAKYNHVIVLFTKDDCLGIVFDTEEEQKAWLHIMLALQNEAGSPKHKYDHVWQVNMKAKGLANSKYLSSGLYRLCLTNKMLSFVKLNKDDPDIEFQLATIRRCGHTESYFFVEAGNAAPTGAGEMWMQVDDSVIAHDMHDLLLKAMKANSKFGDMKPMPTIRGRSHTMDKTNKPASLSNSGGSVSAMKRNMSVGESSTLPRRLKAKSMHVPSTSEVSVPASPGRLRHSQSPNKSLSSNSNQSLRPKSSFVSGRDATAFSLSPAHSPCANSPLSLEMMRCRADSMESHGSRRTDASSVSDDIEAEHMSSGACSMRSDTPDNTEYLSMTPQKDYSLSLSPDVALGGGTTSGSSHTGGYMEMSSPVSASVRSPTSRSPVPPPPSMQAQDKEQYMQMSPIQTNPDCDYFSMSGPSPSLSTTSSGIGTEDSSYLDMAPVMSCLRDVKEKLDGGYLDMQAGKHLASSSEGVMPDKVPSFLSDTESMEEFPKRAYSVGSKPVPLRPVLNESYSYMDMTNSNQSLDKGQNKACSAPHLVEPGLVETSPSPQQLSRSSSRNTTPRSGTPNQFMELDQQDLLMEMDFHNKSSGSRESLSEARSRTSSVGSKDFRSRTSSGGSKDLRSRTSSFGTDFRDRTDSCSSSTSKQPGGSSVVNNPPSSSEGFRNRTQTVCQDSLRPRTSSFDAADMRPRSSSHGNSRFKELSRRIKEKALRHSFKQDHSGKLAGKIISKQASKDSLESQGSGLESSESEYIDIEVQKAMQKGENSSRHHHHKKVSDHHNQHHHPPPHSRRPQLVIADEYMVIKPGHHHQDSDPTSQQHPTPPHLKAIKHVHMSPKIETIISDETSSTSPHIKRRPSQGRRNTSGDQQHSFKHSSSSESVSSTSSSDFSTKGRTRKGHGVGSSPQGQAGVGDYFELSPPPHGMQGTSSPRYNSSGINRNIHKSEFMIEEDSYAVHGPVKDGGSMSGSYGSLEKVSSPIFEDTSLLSATFLGFDKIVSPIREEDNEALFGPKPKDKVIDPNHLLMKAIKHEYVNVNYDARQKQSVGDSSSDIIKGDNKSEVVSSSLAPGDLFDEETTEDSSIEGSKIDTDYVKIPEEGIRDKKTVVKIPEEGFRDKKDTVCSNLVTNTSKAVQRRDHEYCEISFDSVKEGSSSSKGNIGGENQKPTDGMSDYHEMSYPPVEKDKSKRQQRSKPNLAKFPNQNIKDTASNSKESNNSPSTPAPFDVFQSSLFPDNLTDNKIVDQHSGSSNSTCTGSSPHLKTPSSSPIDVFNLGAKPSWEILLEHSATAVKTSPVDIAARKLSSSPSSEGSASSSQSSAICVDISANGGSLSMQQQIGRKASVGSIASLSSLEAISVNPKLRSHGSSSGLNSMNNPGDRRSYQEPLQLVLDSSGQGGAAAAAPAGGNLGPRQLSRTSLGSGESAQGGPVLNYATLDLSASLDEPGFPISGPQISPGITMKAPSMLHSAGAGVNSTTGEAPISYAQIDFKKSEQLQLKGQQKEENT